MVEKKKLIHEPYNKLKGFMRENGIIYSHIAELLGVTPTTVSQKVNGQSDFTVSEAELIMRKYNADSKIFFVLIVAYTITRYEKHQKYFRK